MDSLGFRVADYESMNPQRQSYLVRVADVLIMALCRHMKAGLPDQNGVLGGLLKRSKVLAPETSPLLDHPACRALRDCIADNLRAGNRATAIQQLSLIVTINQTSIVVLLKRAKSYFAFEMLQGWLKGFEHGYVPVGVQSSSVFHPKVRSPMYTPYAAIHQNLPQLQRTVPLF